MESWTSRNIRGKAEPAIPITLASLHPRLPRANLRSHHLNPVRFPNILMFSALSVLTDARYHGWKREKCGSMSANCLSTGIREELGECLLPVLAHLSRERAMHVLCLENANGVGRGSISDGGGTTYGPLDEE